MYNNDIVVKKNKQPTLNVFPKIEDHLRTLKKVQFIRRLDKKHVKEIIGFRKKYNITYEWKEAIRKRYEKMIFDMKNLYKYLDEDISDYVHDDRNIELYKKCRGKIQSTDDRIDIKNILLLQYIAIKHYLNYGTGMKKRSEEDRMRDLTMVGNRDIFIEDIKKLGERINVRAMYEGFEYPNPVVQRMVNNLENIWPTALEYAFNVESPLVQEDVRGFYGILKMGRKKILKDGIFIPIEKLKGLKKSQFLRFCEEIYKSDKSLFGQYEDLTVTKIIDVINTVLIRDIEKIKTKKICRMFAKKKKYDSVYFSSTTIKSEVYRLRRLFGIPVLV